MNTKINEVKNKIPKLSGLVKKSNYYDAKILEIERKYFTNSVYNKSLSEILDVKINKKIGQQIWYSQSCK